MNRFYHALNSRFNIYYNGKVAYDEALRAQQDGHKENYSQRLLMYPVSALPKEKETTGGPFDVTIQKCTKAIRLHSIKTKPARKPGWKNNPKLRSFYQQEEYNPFLKHCWMLQGMAQFHNADFLQASATFSYISHHFTEDALLTVEAQLWQARCYTEMNWLYEAENIFEQVKKKGIPKSLTDEFAAFYANYLIVNKDDVAAIPYLRTAARNEKNHNQRARMYYLLGQLCAGAGKNPEAYDAFSRTIRSNPSYELEFAARIRQTEVQSGGYMAAGKKLRRMIRNPKNKDYLDQLYYALGNLCINQKDTAGAIKNYQAAIEKSTQNGIEKALSQVRLGDIYFEQRDYIHAQPCFSGALASLDKQYEDYARVAKRSEVLDELVIHVEAIHLQDSLQNLVAMPETERLAVIDKIIEQVKKEEEEAKALAEKEEYLAEQEARNSETKQLGDGAQVFVPAAGGNESFYFYNPQTVAQGKAQFQRRWGRRVLEDDWRRRTKEVQLFTGEENVLEEEMASVEEIPDSLSQESSVDADLPPVVVSDDPKSREFYLQQLPFSPEDRAASDTIIADALYNMAMIYKDKLDDLPLSISAFEDLNRRFPGNGHQLESYYQMYLMALGLKDEVLASGYKAKLLQEYPQSDYALAISDPNYITNIRMMDVVQDSIYRQTYAEYLKGNIQAVRSNYQAVAEKYPLASLLPKFMFLNALTYVQEGDAAGFKNALEGLLAKYPTADVSELAGEMLKGILRGRSIVKGEFKEMVWNIRFGTVDGDGNRVADSTRVFLHTPDAPCRVLLVYPTEMLETNQLLFTVAAYNFANFRVRAFDLSTEEVGELSLIQIGGFNNMDEAFYYYQKISEEGGYANTLNGRLIVLPISEENYETLMLGKTLEEYISFFEKEYGDAEPEMVARWKVKWEQPDPVVQDSVLQQPVPEPELQEEQKQEETTLPIYSIRPRRELTLDDIEKIRSKELSTEEARKEKTQMEEEQQKKLEKEQQKIEKQTRKEQLKQREAERKAKEKARKKLQKEKERAYKEKMKQKERERKEKERLREKELKAKEAARKSR